MKTNAAPNHPNVVGFPPLIFACVAATSGLLGWWVSAPLASPAVRWPIGIVLALAAGGLVTAAERAMHAAGTNIRPSQPALAIVRNGPFRFTRNPMYLSLCLLQCALGFFMNNAITLAFVVVLGSLLHFGVVLREERYLEAKFGEPYRELKRSVRRWI